MKSQKRVGVYFRTQNDQQGSEILEFLKDYTEEIAVELGDEVKWALEDSGYVFIRMPCEDVFLAEYREEIKDFFKHWLNKFVNVFRPRLKRLNHGGAK